MHQSFCWVSTPGNTVLRCSSNCSFTGTNVKTTTSPRTQHLSTEVKTPRRARSTYRFPNNWDIKSSVEEIGSLYLPVVTVPNENHMLTPGEVRQVELDYPLFQQILTEGTKDFGCVNINESKESKEFGATGVILSILAVRQVLADETKGAGPKVLVECRCSGRCRVMIPDVSEQSILQSNSRIFKTECTIIHDWLCEEFNDRRQLAEVEWRTWIACTQTAVLMRKLETPGVRTIAVEQELAVWAPKPYDREIATHEWEQTPNVTRNVWCQRAEAFSFGVLRCLQCDDDIMIRARCLTSTVTRLELALEAADKQKAMATARLSLKNALN